MGESYLTSFGDETRESIQRHVTEEATRVNWVRLRIFYIFVMMIEPLLMVFYDLPRMRANMEPFWLYRAYFGLHLAVFVYSTVNVIIAGYILKRPFKRWTEYGAYVSASLVLTLLSFISGLDQVQSVQITVFVINVMMSAMAMQLRMPYNIFVYILPYMTFVFGLYQWQGNRAAAFSNLANGSIFFLGTIVATGFLYRNFKTALEKTRMLESANQKLNYYSTHDPLTTLLNRREFERCVSLSVNELEKKEGKGILILIDIDHFKVINDTYGHLVGDVILKAVSQRLTAHLKDKGYVARWGGEEFLIYLPQETDQHAVILAEELRKCVSEIPFDIGDERTAPVTISLGIATFVPPYYPNFYFAFKEADKALYRAKAFGRNRAEIADSAKLQTTRERAES